MAKAEMKTKKIDDDQLDNVTGGTSKDGDVSIPAARRCRCGVGMLLFKSGDEQFWKCPKCQTKINININQAQA